MEDYEAFVTELADEVWQQLMGRDNPSRVYIYGQKAYGVYKLIMATADDADEWDYIGEIHSNNTKETTRAAIWQLFRRQPIYSAVSTLPVICLTVA
jgi:hypothetical protein